MQNKRILVLLLALSTAAIALAGCHAPEDVDPPTYTYTASDYAFDGPDELPAGWVRLEMVNEGPSPHHVQLYRLDDGHTMQEALDALANGEHPSWMRAVGGPNPNMPGQPSIAYLHLEPGAHVMICEIPDNMGTPHVEHGMAKAVTVTAADAEASEPEGDLSLSLVDFGFAPDGEWTSGDHIVAAENDGAQPHEVAVVRFHGDATFGDVAAAFMPNATGPPPADFMGGVSAIAPGDVAYFPLDLTPGRYALACFVHDPASGAPHFVIGMLHEFEVA